MYMYIAVCRRLSVIEINEEKDHGRLLCMYMYETRIFQQIAIFILKVVEFRSTYMYVHDV